MTTTVRTRILEPRFGAPRNERRDKLAERADSISSSMQRRDQLRERAVDVDENIVGWDEV